MIFVLDFNIEYWFRKSNYYETSSQSITFVFLFHPKTEQQHRGYGSRTPSNLKGRNFVGLNEVDRSYFLRRFLCLRPRSVMWEGVGDEQKI
jgi:hypothetical protein